MPLPTDLPSDLKMQAISLHIDPKHIRESFIRGGGHGGQKINKTASCVQLIYEPLNIEIRYQEHREQSKNRIGAYALLIEKVLEWRTDVERSLAEHDFRERKQLEPRPRKAKEKVLRQKKHTSEKKTWRSGTANTDQ